MSALDRNDKIDALATLPFLDGPGEHLAETIAAELKKVKPFVLVFGEYIDAYPREDYPQRALPALRVYSERYQKTSESWWIDGEVKLDCIWPPSIRRQETQTLQDMIGAALLQQFRRPSFFKAVEDQVPGLNFLGREFGVDKTRGFALANSDEIAPVTCLTASFRIDQRAWDDYLKASYRTKDDPFEKTLADLTAWLGTIEGLREDGTVEVTLQATHTVKP